MKISVTGAGGFVGRHVLDALVCEQVEIYAITRDAENLSTVDKSIKIIELDIYDCDANVFEKIGSPDILIHLAWSGLPNFKSLHHFETELPKQYCFLKRMVDAGLLNLFVSGTCFEYGMQSGALAANTITNPTNPYGFAKDVLRKQLEYLQQVKPFNLTWARLFYMYGEGQAINSLYPQLKQAVLRGDKEFNMSGGEQVRDYLPVETVAAKIVELSLSAKDKGCVNISSEQPISVRHLVEQWVDENDWNITLNFGCYPYPDYEPMTFWGINKVRENE